MLEWLLGGIIVMLIFLILWLRGKVVTLSSDVEYYKTRASNFENDYWNLLNSGAVDKDNWEVHLSWLPRGLDNAVRRK